MAGCFWVPAPCLRRGRLRGNDGGGDVGQAWRRGVLRSAVSRMMVAGPVFSSSTSM